MKSKFNYFKLLITILVITGFGYVIFILESDNPKPYVKERSIKIKS